MPSNLMLFQTVSDQGSLREIMHSFVVSDVPADGLAP